jgi:ribosomal protein S21
MFIINLDKNLTLEKALKVLKQKVIKSKQNELLRDKKEFTKKSVVLRTEKKKAIYRQKLKSKSL